MNYGENAQEELERKYLDANEASQAMTGDDIKEAYGISGEWADEIFHALRS